MTNISTLTLRANMENIEIAINKATSLDLSKYTIFTVIRVKITLSVAKFIVSDSNISVEQQWVVNKCETELLSAINALKFKPVYR